MALWDIMPSETGMSRLQDSSHMRYPESSDSETEPRNDQGLEQRGERGPVSGWQEEKVLEHNSKATEL